LALTKEIPTPLKPSDRGRVAPRLWWGIGAGPLAWGVDLAVSYALTQHACSTGHYYVLHVITLLALIVALSGFFVSLDTRRQLHAGDDAGGSTHDRAYFDALVGMGFSVFFFIIIIAGAVPRWILNPCQ
jgi:hypothetical protein